MVTTRSRRGGSRSVSSAALVVNDETRRQYLVTDVGAPFKSRYVMPPVSNDPSRYLGQIDFETLRAQLDKGRNPSSTSS